MLNLNHFEQLSQRSNKILFLYNLHNRKLDYLSGPVQTICKEDVEALKNKPSLITAQSHPEDRGNLKSQFLKLLNGTRSEVCYRLLQEDGTIKQIKVEGYPLEDEAGDFSFVAGTVEDITKQTEYIDYLIEFGRKKNNVLEVVSHDLRGPLAIVKSVADMMEYDHSQQNYQDTSKYIKIIHEAGRACMDLILNILDEEVTKSPLIRANKKRTNVVAKVKEIVGLLKSVDSIPQYFEMHTSSDAIYAELDEMKFTQILNNLISNAIKFTQPEGAINITLKEEDTNFVLILSDNGIGIPKHLQAHVFERHTEAARDGLYGERSRGIGLSIVKELVEVQDGNIRFESEEGKGTTFFVTFPLDD